MTELLSELKPPWLSFPSTSGPAFTMPVLFESGNHYRARGAIPNGRVAPGNTWPATSQFQFPLIHGLHTTICRPNERIHILQRRLLSAYNRDARRNNSVSPPHV